MRCEDRNESKPAWWQLYASVLLLVGLIGLVEVAVPAGGSRTIIEIAVVCGTFGLMLIWVRHNRVAMELNEWDAHRPRGLVIAPSALEGHGDAPGHTGFAGNGAITQPRRAVR